MNIQICKQLIDKLKSNPESKDDCYELLELFNQLNFTTPEILNFIITLNKIIHVPINLMILAFKENRQCEYTYKHIRSCTNKEINDWIRTKHQLDITKIIETLENSLYIHFVKTIDNITNDIETIIPNKKPLFSAWSRMGKRLGFQDAII
jgi:hypothetical protein